MRPIFATGLCLAAAACHGDVPATPQAAAVTAPLSGTLVPAGGDLAAAIAAAAPGATLLLQAGEYLGPFVVDKSLVLWGPREAVLTSRAGTTLRVLADGVKLQGFTVRGSGQRFDLMDGGVHLQGKDIEMVGVTVRDTLFGVLAERCERVTLRGNLVLGTGLPAMGLRGDGIRLWETNDSLVEGNTVRDSRDMVVWYSSRNHLVDNTVTGSRYGTHFMYSHENLVEQCRYVGCEVGVFVMYSHDITVRRCLLARSGGSAGIGIGLKESGNITLEDSWLLANTTGIYIDNAPLDPDHFNRYERNVLRFSETAVALHSGVKRSTFADNQFADNGAVVKIGGDGDALSAGFAGNYYDTYQGYDLDGDGRGDLPFEFRRLSTQIEGRYPELALLHGAPAMMMVDVVGEVMPLFAPRPLLADPQPRMRPVAMAWSPEVHDAR